jgi:hypothetical protein
MPIFASQNALRGERTFSNGPIGLVLNLKVRREAKQTLSAGKFTKNVLQTSWLGTRTRELWTTLTLGSLALIHHEAVPSTPYLHNLCPYKRYGRVNLSL